MNSMTSDNPVQPGAQPAEGPTLVCPYTKVRIGDRIELLHMPNDPDPIPVGTRGTVIGVEQKIGSITINSGQIAVQWDIPRSLRLVVDQDVFRVLGPDEE